jgi:flagellar FliJ protein
MEPVKDLAEAAERDAGALVAAARGALEGAEKQLKQLQEYRAEYLGRVSEGARDGVRLANYHAFLGRLSSAVEAQEKEVAAALAKLERATDAWRERRIEAASIGRAVDKFATGERRVVDQRAQRDADERSMQRVIRNREPS